MKIEKEIIAFWAKISLKEFTGILKNLLFITLWQIFTILLAFSLTSQYLFQYNESGFYLIWIIYFFLTWAVLTFIFVKIYRQGKEIGLSTMKYFLFTSLAIIIRMIYIYLKNMHLEYAIVFSIIKILFTAIVFIYYPSLIYKKFINQPSIIKDIVEIQQGSNKRRESKSNLEPHNAIGTGAGTATGTGTGGKRNSSRLFNLPQKIVYKVQSDAFETHLLYCKTHFSWILADLASVLGFVATSAIAYNVNVLENL